MSETKTADFRKKYKQSKRIVHNLEKTICTHEQLLSEKDAQLEYYSRSLNVLRGAMERVQGGQAKLTKEEILNQMQTELPSSDDEEEEEDEDEDEDSANQNSATTDDLREARKKAGITTSFV